ncbi:MAG TPA: AsnC family transcriptional regulator [Lachnospiraceae bacterium]|jgi:Lrp/AsnC family leucine-responsive transcriptional regulator|nr:AsnC family transcriptional regulator [Lachnospiraceae bacterium]
MDQIDREILERLKQDSKQNYKSIGDQIHMTGQAVGNRIRKMEEEGIINGYTVRLNSQAQGLIVAYITLFMKTNDHYRLKQFVIERPEVLEAVRISGEGCYILKVEVNEHAVLNEICDNVLKFANYRINIVTDVIK